MKLSVSNIAWNIEEEQEIFDILLSNGVTGIEVAPTKIKYLHSAVFGLFHIVYYKKCLGG